MTGQNIQSAFEVYPIEGQVTKTIYNYKDGKRIETEVEEDAGFMVYFPQGHSIRVATREELNALGFGGSASLVDMDTGDVVVQGQNGSLKQLVESRTKNHKHARALTKEN